MSIDQELLDLLVCPETHEKLKLVELDLIEKINQAIAAGKLSSRSGRNLSHKIEGGLLRTDGRFLYPIIQKIPNLLIDDAIPMEGLD